MIDTANVSGRRQLHFASANEVLAEVDRLVDSERSGTLKGMGNWTFGQTLGHLASWIEYIYDGYPPELRPPWFVKLYFKFARNSFLHGKMPAGRHIPRIKGGTLATEVIPTDEGVRRYRRAWERLLASAPKVPNPLLGLLTHEEWIAMHLRHAELHLSFFRPA